MTWDGTREGQQTAAFTIAALPVASTVSSKVTATLGTVSKSAQIAAIAPGAASITGKLADAMVCEGDIAVRGTNVTIAGREGSWVSSADGTFTVYADPGALTL